MEGDKLDPNSYFGYGEPVMASAAGEVVFVIKDEVQDRAALTKRTDESPEQAQNRISRYNMRRYAADFKRAAAGNIVVIRHESAAAIEYSSYGHLKAGSVLVAVGDAVEQGQQIAAVGDTGDSAAVHLHFQVNAGPDPLVSRSLPFKFTDQRPMVRGLDPGRFVHNGE